MNRLRLSDVSHPALVLLGVIFLAVGLGFILWKVPQWQISPELVDPQARANVENEARRTIAQILLSGLVLAGLYFTWRRVRAADQTVEVSREQQITERFTRAVEQLGSDKLAIRLGGIYALERIAKDSPKDHWQVMEVLTAYVRENDRWKGERGAHFVPVSEWPPTHEARLDIQVIFTVLARRRIEWDTLSRGLDLESTDLRGISLNAGNFQRASFIHANLQGANLSGVNLENASLVGVNLYGAFLVDANLQGAYLIFANLEGALLSNTNLQRSILSRANLQGAFITGTNLLRTDLRGTDLSRAVGLTQEQIDSAIIDENTILPDYLRKV